MVYSHLRLSDKPFMGSVTEPSRAQDTVDMAKIVFGADFVDQNCVVTSLINANSPMTFDATMLGAARVYAQNNQATVISPFILAGAMSPVTVVGTCTQILAEAMAGICFTQLVRPGAPVIFGTFSSAVSMHSGAPTFGTPEPSMVIFTCAALARRLGVPFRSGGGLCASKLPDAQAAYESANTLQSAMLAGVNFMLHTAGWLEGGLTASLEKFIIDVEMLQMFASLMQPVECNEDTLALSAFAEIEPGDHFFGTEHTLARYDTAFYTPLLSDWSNFETWSENGAQDTTQRANRIARQALAEFTPPPLADERLAEIDEFIDKRVAQGGASLSA